MFKLPDGIPTFRNSAQDWADYAEYHAILNGKINLYGLTKPSRLVSDEDVVLGIEDDTDKYLEKVDEISTEILYRIQVGECLYPFEIEDHDYSLRFAPKSDQGNIIYPYLLLATRAKMDKDRIKASIDGSLLFEYLCSIVAQNYFGPRAEVDILGTSKEDITNFRDKLREITHVLGEGGDIHDNHGHKPQDGKVDVIVWKGFKDQQPSKMIGFGQCKTGTNWVEKLSELDTEAFCKTWFTRQPVLTPVRMFFTAQYFPRDIFRERANLAGLVFDRFRILDYLPEKIDENLLDKIYNWTEAIKEHYSKN
ncbi:hypothetical protein RYH73_01310 [Olivibacter sp. CPCC 100613]|uniref:hypothetical protein n=1 Tax=Olivibacter sp. CPCC 100613 TaxID=3079931 RepID=UPI002FF8BCCD